MRNFKTKKIGVETTGLKFKKWSSELFKDLNDASDDSFLKLHKQTIQPYELNRCKSLQN